MFLTGNYPEIKKDLPEAKRWFEKAAEQSDEQGMYQLALCYLTGSGAPRDEEQGRHWLLRAAAKGYQPAIKQAEELGISNN